jgi:adenylate cyclase
VYNGDVLNTTSRLESVCADYKTDLIVSGPLMEKLQVPANFTPELLGCVPLKGKMQPMDLYAVRRATA